MVYDANRLIKPNGSLDKKAIENEVARRADNDLKSAVLYHAYHVMKEARLQQWGHLRETMREEWTEEESREFHRLSDLAFWTQPREASDEFRKAAARISEGVRDRAMRKVNSEMEPDK